MAAADAADPAVFFHAPSFFLAAAAAREFAVFTRVGVEVRRFPRGSKSYVEAALRAETVPANWYVAAVTEGGAR